MVKTRSMVGIEFTDSPAGPSQEPGPSDTTQSTTNPSCKAGEATKTSPTATTAAAMPAIMDFDTTLWLEGASPRRAPSSKASSKARRKQLLRAKEELLQRQVDLAAARVAMLEEDSDDEDSEEDGGERRTVCDRTATWVQGQASQHAIAVEAHPVQTPQIAAPVASKLQICTPPPVVTRDVQPRPAVGPAAEDQAPLRARPCPAMDPAAGEQALQRTSAALLPAASPAGAFNYAELANAITMAAHAIQPAYTPASRQAPELPIFSGASSEWLPFKTAFTESVACVGEQENLARLRRCLRGPAREAAQCLFVGATTSAEVLKLLSSRFGRPDAICMAEIDKLRGLPRLSENARDICVFSSRVANIVATIKALGKPHYMHNPEPVRHVVEKLPPSLRNEFYNYVAEQPEDAPELPMLAAFLDRAASRCSRFAPAEVIATGERREPAQAPKRAIRTYHVETTTLPQSARPGRCPVCGTDGHRAKDCSSLKTVEPSVRWEIVKKHRLCFRCLKVRKYKHTCKSVKCTVSGCKYSHHPLLHDPNYVPQVSTTAHIIVEEPPEQEEAIVASAKRNGCNTLLKVIPVRIIGPRGEFDTFALLDDGSTCTIIETAVAEAVGAVGTPAPFSIEGVAGTKFNVGSAQKVTLHICGRHGEPIMFTARTMERLSLSPQSIPNDIVERYDYLGDLKDEILIHEAVPTVLIGQDNWNLLLAHTIRRGKCGQPVASLTDLGWVLHGTHTSGCEPKQVHHLNHMRELPDEIAIEVMMKEHFAMECLGVEKKRPYTDNEQRALNLLGEHTCQIPAGGFETSLLWRSDDLTPPDNRLTALRRLDLVERKLNKAPEQKEKYQAQIQRMLDLGYAEPAPAERQQKYWYLPHFGVTHPEKPEKLRIVHDASAVTRGESLNSMLLSGPDLLQSLPGVLMRFRQHPVAVTADISDMFLRISIREADRDMQRFLWRDGRHDGPPTEYRMKSVIFGATSSPCTAIYVKDLNARQFEQRYPEAAAAVVRNHYMDDYLASFGSAEEAIRVSHQVAEIHRNANFFLSKWASNSPQVLRELSASETQISLKLELDPTKILGMIWNPQKDTLSFNVNEKRIDGALLRGERVPTKREALKATMSLYDPLGLATPVTIQAKRILQSTWRSRIEWDQTLRPEEADEWKSWGRQVLQLTALAIPRNYAHFTAARERELHTFVDASSTAYAAAVYWRVVDSEGTVSTSLIAGKARVAPIGKVQTIPRMELQAAVLGCRLALTAQAQHDTEPIRRVFWSDSRTVLSWVRNGAREYKPFVAHRIAEIRDSPRTEEWRWVPTNDNVADDATRAIPTEFNSKHRWFVGPKFLSRRAADWPKEAQESQSTPDPEALEEEKVCAIAPEGEPQVSVCKALPSIDRFSDWRRLIRTTARVLQFIAKLRAARTGKTIHAFQRMKKGADLVAEWRPGTSRGDRTVAGPFYGDTTVKRPVAPFSVPSGYLVEAESLWVKAIQEAAFADELRLIRRGQRLPGSSRLSKLAIVLNEKGVIQLRSRVACAEGLSNAQRQPAILPGEHKWVQLYCLHAHRLLHHGGVETTANEVRQHYWVLQLRKAVKRQVTGCLLCRIRRGMPAQPSTGNHPANRLGHHQRPFTFSAIDYFGPYLVTVGRSRQKRYGVLFTCLTTRAVHLEIAGSLTTDSAIMALRRFISRRGCPTEIYSDNGTNLRGADAELRLAAQNALEYEANVHHMKWKYIPPSAPFMGGAWERLIRSVKRALFVTLNERAPKEEVLNTLFVEIEHTINSRPLTHVSYDPNDDEALTPNHFLLGGPSRVPQPGVFMEGDAAGRSEWRISQRLADSFWSRWVRDYLPELQHRRDPQAKGDPLHVGDLVLIADGTLTRNCWPRGIIVATHPGLDGEVRVVSVKTGGRVLRRPTRKIVRLP